MSATHGSKEHCTIDMETLNTSQIRWSTLSNRDPIPASAFWPPLALPSSSSLAHEDVVPSKVVTGDLPRREAFVEPTQDQELLDHFKEERRSLRSLRRFLERGIGVDAIRASKVTSRRSSTRTVQEDLESPSQRSSASATEAEASVNRTQDISLLSMLRASRVSSRSLPANPENGHTGLLASSGAVLLSREEFPIAGTPGRQSELMERRKGNWFSTRTKYLDITLSVNRKIESLQRVFKKLRTRPSRVSKIKRRSRMPMYDGT